MPRRIRVRGDTISFPDVCANCLKPANQYITVKAQRALSRHRESKEVEVPLCEACNKLYKGETPFHARVEAATRRIPILQVTQILAGIVVFINGIIGAVTGMEVLARNRPAWPWWVAGAGVVVFVVATVLLSRARALSEAPLPKEEAIARRCVRIINFAGDITDFYVENDEYAEAFQRKNPGSSVIVAD